MWKQLKRLILDGEAVDFKEAHSYVEQTLGTSWHGEEWEWEVKAEGVRADIAEMVASGRRIEAEFETMEGQELSGLLTASSVFRGDIGNYADFQGIGEIKEHERN